MRGLAEIAERFGSGTLRLTVWQNLLISDVADRDVGICIAAINALGLGIEASAIRARPGRLHRQCRLQVLGLQHQGPCAAARRLSRSARGGRPADQHPSHRLPSFLRPALCRRHRPARLQGRCSGEESVEGYHVYIGGGAASTAEQAMAREYAQSVAFDDLPPLLERLLAAWLAHRQAPGEIVLRVLPPPRDRRTARARRSRAGAGAGGMNAMAPIPSLIPENAPFSTEQRAWLNGFFAAYLGVNGEPAAADAASARSRRTGRGLPLARSVARHGRAPGAGQGRASRSAS